MTRVPLLAPAMDRPLKNHCNDTRSITSTPMDRVSGSPSPTVFQSGRAASKAETSSINPSPRRLDSSVFSITFALGAIFEEFTDTLERVTELEAEVRALVLRPKRCTPGLDGGIERRVLLRPAKRETAAIVDAFAATNCTITIQQTAERNSRFLKEFSNFTFGYRVLSRLNTRYPKVKFE